MDEALALGAMGLGRTAPNPPVGALVVRNQDVLGRGFHPKAGEPHAEPLALREAGDAARGADLYVTLEPCAHTGRTGPCTQAIQEAGIGRVFVSALDPNPAVAGNGAKWLRDRGIPVQVGLRAEEGRELLQGWFAGLQLGRPRVRVKAALSLDGQMAPRSGISRWITSAPARRIAHQFRDRADGVLVGVGTIEVDDPSLTTRDPAPRDGRQPRALILDPNGRCPIQARALRPGTRLAWGEEVDPGKEADYLAKGCAIDRIPRDVQGRLDLSALLSSWYAQGFQEILLEGGGKTIAGFLRADLVDHFDLIQAPLLLGAGGFPLLPHLAAESMPNAWRFEWTRVRSLSPDIWIRARRRTF